MINLRQIAVLIGTGAAVAGVLVVPDQAISNKPAQVASPKSEAAPATALEKPVPSRALASEDPAADPTEEIARLEEKRAAIKARLEAIAEAYNRTAQLVSKSSITSADEPPGEELPAFARHSDLTFAPEASFSRIDGCGVSNGSSARLLSNMNLGGDLFWRQHWSEKFSTRLGLGFSRVDFQGAPNSKTIDQKGKTFGRLGAGANYYLNDRWEFGAGFGLRQEIFYVATGAASIRVDQVAVPRAEASVRYDALKLAPFRFGMGARSAYLFPTSADGYSVEGGSSHRLSLYIKEEDADGRLRPTGEIFYDRKRQDTNLNRKTETELGLQLGITWKFKP